ncbi:hypothetical protein GUITHDRAFT_136927 [Guillardia theta CCMP2712]|uniref:Uncharacterized protein n=1 Tax=Guillardia theta (strain CCMP2712) TaxID=905079 RepID=L1JIN4_GUITC|nr:hypothetical protein GUITHDRAFT_136927 [Guillardia theta CCMP2712]EKX47955.1 hypothetical protein GUITHDRAFT_136927 [Guillardia theta CCMP2712]|eukprot:XP_005834935.1 hypothetical protein GUITHDRAFT_136927 [Guillardia theta CCMP2712]
MQRELVERKRELARVKDAFLLDGKRSIQSLLKDAKKFEKASRQLAKEREEATRSEKEFEIKERFQHIKDYDPELPRHQRRHETHTKVLVEFLGGVKEVDVADAVAELDVEKMKRKLASMNTQEHARQA